MIVSEPTSAPSSLPDDKQVGQASEKGFSYFISWVVSIPPSFRQYQTPLPQIITTARLPNKLTFI